MTIRILTILHQIEEFVETAQTAADSERNALGFLPTSAYVEAAAQEKLFVAVIEKDGRHHYAGHLFFGGTYPTARIFQVYVEPGYRAQGVGAELVRALTHRCENEQFLSMKASVAEDLEIANRFYERMGFQIALVKPGGLARGRNINVRVRNLKVPSLLNLLTDTLPPVGSDFGLGNNLSRRSPLYLIDLNVLFDIARKRSRSQEAGRVIRAACRNTIRLALSEEFVEELRRNSQGIGNDPILQFALQLPRLVRPSDAEMGKYECLGRILFASRYQEARLTVQDHSDVRHLATAVHHRAAGFITSENAILRARAKVRSEFGVDIVGLEEFMHLDEPEPAVDLATVAVATKTDQIEIRDLRGQQDDRAADFLAGIRVSDEEKREALGGSAIEGPRRQLVVSSGDAIIALGSWNRVLGSHRVTDILVLADEAHTLAETAVDFLLSRACVELSVSAASLLRLEDPPGRTITRRLAIAHGFRPTAQQVASHRSLQKISVGRPIDHHRWPSFRDQIKRLSGVVFPRTMPQLTGSEDTMTVTTAKGAKTAIKLCDLESLLSPVLFLFQKRYGAIVPIQRRFADELLGTSDQPSFLEFREASLLNERAYICTPRAAKALAPGTPLLFYESGTGGGRASVVAVGRSIASDIVFKSELPPDVGRRSVLDAQLLNQITAGERVLATQFDNVIRLPNLVSFRKLKSLKAVDGANLRTARPLSGSVMLDVVAEGWSNA